MSSDTKVFTLAFEQNNRASDRDVLTFLKKIAYLMVENSGKIIRRINGKLMRVHAYYWGDNNSFIAIPFGKLKTSNKPFGMNPDNQQLKDISEDMFDVTSLAYHERFRVSLLTVNQNGPSESDIENYLNSFLAPEEQYRIFLRPIKINEGLQEIRRASEARNIRIDLDLGRPLNDFFGEQVNEQNGISQFISSFAQSSKESLEPSVFSLTLGVGRSKNATLNVDATLELLEAFNINSDCIKEVTVIYRKGMESKLSRARLKQGSTLLRIPFSIKDRIAPEYLKNNIEEKLLEYQEKFYPQVNDYYRNIQTVGDNYEFVHNFEEGPSI